MPVGNGNKYKGNKLKKRNRRQRKSPVAEFDEETDKYAIIITRSGGSHVKVLTLDNEELSVRIPGKFYKRVFFRKDNCIIITQCAENMYEIKGKVKDTLISGIQNDFSKLDTRGKSKKGCIKFAASDNESEDDDSFNFDDI